MCRRSHLWVKRKAQRGLVAELVAGRLGVLVEAAPRAVIVNVENAAMPADGSANHLPGGVNDDASQGDSAAQTPGDRAPGAEGTLVAVAGTAADPERSPAVMIARWRRR